MPRRFSSVDKGKWLEAHEQGKSENYIAREIAHCDVRTVKKGLEEARRIRNANLAQVELVKDALKRHYDDLLRVADEVVTSMVLPQPELNINWSREYTTQPLSISKARVDYEGDGKGTVILSVEDTPSWTLFCEHLKRHRLMKDLSTWKRIVVDHLGKRDALQRKLLTVLENETGLNIGSEGIMGIEYLATHDLYRMVIRKVLGFPEGKYSEEDIKVGKAGEVIIAGNLLARTVEGKEEQYKSSILTVLEKLLRSQEAGETASTYETLVNITNRVKSTAQEISLLGLVPGRCRICKQLGL